MPRKKTVSKDAVAAVMPQGRRTRRQTMLQVADAPTASTVVPAAEVNVQEPVLIVSRFTVDMDFSGHRTFQSEFQIRDRPLALIFPIRFLSIPRLVGLITTNPVSNDRLMHPILVIKCIKIFHPTGLVKTQGVPCIREILIEF